MIEKVLAALLVLLILALAVFVAVKAPCGLWRFSRAADVPARCVKEFIR